MRSRIWPIMRKEFIQIIRDPRTLGVMFVTPLLQLVLLGYAAQTDVRNVPLAVFDQDHSAASRALIGAFVESGQFAVARYVDTNQELAGMIDGGQAKAGLIIPPRYAAALQRNERAHVSFVLDGSDPTVAGSSLSAAGQIGQSHATAIQQQQVSRRGLLIGGLPLEVRTRVWYNPDMLSAVFIVPGLIGLVLQLQATLLTSSAVVRERERGTMEQLIVTPIRPFELIIGKIMPYALVAMAIMIEVLVLGTTLFHVQIKGSVLLLLAISCLFLLTTLGIGLLISTIANTQQEAFLLTFLTLLPSIFLSGFIYPIAAMPRPLQLVSSVIPLTYFITVVRGIIIKGIGLEALMPQVAALTIFGVVLIVLASARFRKRLD